MKKPPRILAVDCETDRFRHGAIIKPFLWGAYDGHEFKTWENTEDFVYWLANQRCIAYAHNGGKFDFMFLIQFIAKLGQEKTRCQIINGRIVKMKFGKAELRCSYAIIPEPLKKFGTKKEIDYRKMDADVRHLHWDEIVEYLFYDCKTLFDVLKEYRAIAGSQTTIASNAMRFCKSTLKIDPGKTNAHFDGLMREFYYGGRTECFRPGTHRNISILDIKSAYPYAMSHDHATGAERVHITDKEFHALDVRERQRSFIRVRCFADGCFPVRSQTGLDFPRGMGEFAITGWEYETAREFGLFRDCKILDAIVFPRTINFAPYVNHWFAYKSAHDKKTQPVQYTIGKIMQNSLYGKLAQNPLRYFDYVIHAAGTECDYEDGWTKAAEYGDIEIHRRSVLEKYERNFGENWRGRPFFNNVATGASITGFTRAHLLRAIHTIGEPHIIYCDTDSVICDDTADVSEIPMSDKLGDWENEGHGIIGHFAGKKTYGIKLDKICDKFKPDMDQIKCESCGSTEKKHGHANETKIATKGGKADFDQIRGLLEGKTIVWKSPAPHFSLAGAPNYTVRSIRSTAKKSFENATT